MSIAFLFPGQGAQSVGMGRQVVEELPQTADLFAQAAEVVGCDLLELCLQGPEERLHATEFSQPALFVTSMAAVEKLRQEDPQAVEQCQFAAGLSLGEYSALAFAGALDFESGLKLVSERGRAMQAAADQSQGSMVSVLGLEVRQVEQLCDQARGSDTLQVANLLCPGNTVVSGSRQACERITKLAEEAGAMRVIPLAVAGAFHTELMDPAKDRLEAALAATEIRVPRIPVVSNVDAAPHTDPEEIRSLLARQLISPVRWEDSMKWLISQDVSQCWEVGTGRVLKGLLKRINRKLPCQSVEI